MQAAITHKYLGIYNNEKSQLHEYYNTHTHKQLQKLEIAIVSAYVAEMFTLQQHAYVHVSLMGYHLSELLL